MNREEAIEIIRKEYACVDADCNIERSCGKCDLMMPSKEPILEAYKMAINALSQEPTDENLHREREQAYMQGYEDASKRFRQEPCTDAVSREMALEKMADYVASGYADSVEDFEEYSRIICQLPSVTPKSETVTEFVDRCRECGKMRKGHWIYDKTIENWRCSKCNEETPKTMGYCGTANFMAKHFKFCNHCGVRMVEPQESEGDACKDCYYNDGEVHAECVVCEKAESEDKE